MGPYDQHAEPHCPSALVCFVICTRQISGLFCFPWITSVLCNEVLTVTGIGRISSNKKKSMRIWYIYMCVNPVASFTKEVNTRLSKHPLIFNGYLANRKLTSLVNEATAARGFYNVADMVNSAAMDAPVSVTHP